MFCSFFRLVGVGEASFISLAAPFIDDNAPPAKVSFLSFRSCQIMYYWWLFFISVNFALISSVELYLHKAKTGGIFTVYKNTIYPHIFPWITIVWFLKIFNLILELFSFFFAQLNSFETILEPNCMFFLLGKVELKEKRLKWKKK
jgi:hypothetical protein